MIHCGFEVVERRLIATQGPDVLERRLAIGPLGVQEVGASSFGQTQEVAVPSNCVEQPRGSGGFDLSTQIPSYR